MQLKDKSLFIQKAFVNGEWVDAESGKTFEVHGIEPQIAYEAGDSAHRC
jgi:hypothetical protein